MFTGLQLSVAVAVKVTTALHKPASLFCDMASGVVITGDCVSATVMTCEATLLLPVTSVAVHVLVMV
jgi:hypothetical protein